MEQRCSWDSISISVYHEDVHDVNKTECAWKRAVKLRFMKKPSARFPPGFPSQVPGSLPGSLCCHDPVALTSIVKSVQTCCSFPQQLLLVILVTDKEERKLHLANISTLKVVCVTEIQKGYRFCTFYQWNLDVKIMAYHIVEL